MEAGLAGDGGALVGVIGKLRVLAGPARSLVALVALRVRRPQTSAREAIAGGTGRPMAGPVGRRLQGQTERVPVRPGEGGLGRPIRTPDKAGKAIIATRRRLRRAHTRRLRVPRARQVRQAILRGPSFTDAGLVVQAVRVPTRGRGSPHPARPCPVKTRGPLRIGAWMRRGGPISPEARLRPTPIPISRSGRPNTPKVAAEAAAGLPSGGRRQATPCPTPGAGLRPQVVVRQGP